MGKAPQTGLQPANNDGFARESLPGTVGIDDGGPVGAQTHPAAGAVGVGRAALLGGGIVGHHGVDVSPTDEYAVPGLTHVAEGVGAAPVRLGQDGHPVALRLQAAGDDGCAEGWVVYIGIGGDHQKVIVPPVPAVHILLADRKKVGRIHGVPPRWMAPSSSRKRRRGAEINLTDGALHRHNVEAQADRRSGPGGARRPAGQSRRPRG